MFENNKKKEEQLGMSLGKAANRLKKSLMFRLVEMLNLNKCYRCSELIESEKDLSIDHIKVWLDSDDPVRLYFDLGNVAFSHLRCNITAARKPHKVIWEEGKMYCCSCKQQLPMKKFPPSYRGKRGRTCTKCNSEASAERRKRKKEKERS